MVKFLFQLRDSAVRLFLALSTGRCDEALSSGLCASTARKLGVCWVLIAAHLQSAAGLTRAWPLGVVAAAAAALAWSVIAVRDVAVIDAILCELLILGSGALRAGLIASARDARCARALREGSGRLRGWEAVVWIRGSWRVLGIDSDVRVGGLLVLLLLLLVLLLLLRVLRLEARRRRWWKRWCRGGLDVGAARGRTESRIYDMLSTHSVAVCPSAPSASVGSVSRYRIARVDGRLHQGQGKGGPASRAGMERILNFFSTPSWPMRSLLCQRHLRKRGQVHYSRRGRNGTRLARVATLAMRSSDKEYHSGLTPRKTGGSSMLWSMDNADCHGPYMYVPDLIYLIHHRARCIARVPIHTVIVLYQQLLKHAFRILPN